MTWLSEVLAAAKEIAKEDTIIRYGDRPFPNADFIRNELTVYIRRAIRRALRKYPNLKRREITYLTNETHKAMMSLIWYPQLYSYWESRYRKYIGSSRYGMGFVRVGNCGVGFVMEMMPYGKLYA